MSGKLGNKIKELVVAEQWTDLKELLLNTEEEWTLEVLGKGLQGSQSTQILGGVLTSLKCTTRESSSLRYKIYEKTLNLCQNELISSRDIGGLVGILMMHVDAFPPNYLIDLVNIYVSHMRQGNSLEGRWVDLLGKLVSTVGHMENLMVDNKEIGGADYRYQVLKTLCDFKWNGATTVTLLPVIKDMGLPKEELMDVLLKVERVLSKVEYQSVPPILYHMILLTHEGSQLPASEVLQIIISYFDKEEDKLLQRKKKKKTNTDDDNDLISAAGDGYDSDETNMIEDTSLMDLREAEGTVILHVMHQAQHNPDLVQDYLKIIKSSTWLADLFVTPFNLALALSLASVERYREQIIETMKSCLLKGFRQAEKRNKSMWLRETWTDEIDVKAVFQSTIDNSMTGWEQVSEGLVTLGFSLLESGGGLRGETFTGQHAVQLGILILHHIVKQQPQIAPTILKELCNLIITASSSVNYIELFAKIASSSPLVVLEHQNIVRELLNQLTFLTYHPVSAHTQLLHACLPLLKMSMPLKDALMLVLRKMLFSGSVGGRIVAVEGFLQFLRHFRVLGTLPSSQASMTFSSTLSQVTTNADIHVVFNSSTNEALCLELVGVLRRCFSQQWQVRATLYSGLYDVVRSNSKLSVSILNLLHQHLKQFVDLKQATLNPILTTKLYTMQTEQAILVEPFADLLASLASCKIVVEKKREQNNADSVELDDEDEEELVKILNNLCTLFDVFTEKFLGCDLDDLDMDKTTEFSSSCAAGQKNTHLATIYIGVFDVLIGHHIETGALQSEEKLKNVFSLFKTQKKLIELVREKSGKAGRPSKSGKKDDGSKGRGRPSANNKMVKIKSLLSLKTSAFILTATIKGYKSTNRECLEMLKSNHDLTVHILSSVEQHINECKGMSSLERRKVFPQLKIISSALLKKCVDDLGVGDASDEREVQELRLVLQILHQIMTLFHKYFKDDLLLIYKELLNMYECGNVLDEYLKHTVKHCQKMLLRILGNEESKLLMKDAIVVIHIMTLAVKAMNSESKQLEEAADWLNQLCKDRAIENGNLCESLLSLLFYMSDQLKANHSTSRSITREIHQKLGDMEEGIELEVSNKYQIVSEESAASALGTVLTNLDEHMVLVELSLNKARACLQVRKNLDMTIVEKNMTSRLGIAIQAMHEIIQTTLPLCSMDSTVKTAIKIYNVFSHYIKYYLEYFRSKNYAQISERFEKLVHLSHTLLSDQIYHMITYIEGAQRAAAMEKKNSGTMVNRALKEFRLIPKLVFAIEQHTRLLFDLARKSKVDLVKDMKLSTARDFRIMPSAIQEALEEEECDAQNEEENEDKGEDDSDNNDREEAENRENEHSDDDRGTTSDNEGNKKKRSQKSSPNDAPPKKKSKLSKK